MWNYPAAAGLWQTGAAVVKTAFEQYQGVCMGTGQVILAGEGQDVGGVICKVRAEESDGAYSVLELTLPAGGGASLHTHHREDEILYIAAGECAITFGGETHPAPAGSVVQLPKGLPHAFRNTGNAPARLIITVIPGGLENFFEAAASIEQNDPDAGAKFDALARQYEIDFNPTNE